MALSQHGMVAPVTIHHRVDFAASMIDGRTVGEVGKGLLALVGVAQGVEIGAADRRSRDARNRISDRLADAGRVDDRHRPQGPVGPLDDHTIDRFLVEAREIDESPPGPSTATSLTMPLSTIIA